MSRYLAALFVHAPRSTAGGDEGGSCFVRLLPHVLTLRSAPQIRRTATRWAVVFLSSKARLSRNAMRPCPAAQVGALLLAGALVSRRWVIEVPRTIWELQDRQLSSCTRPEWRQPVSHDAHTRFSAASPWGLECA